MRKVILKHIEKNDLFTNTQHGFRKGRSCLSQLLHHYDYIISAIEEKASYDVIYTDFAKAFDKCDFNIICQKLKKFGINGKVGRWVKHFLTKRCFSVVVNGSFSHYEKVLSSVPQGTVLAPLLFLIMINDIGDKISSCNIGSFADDTKIARAIKTNKDCKTLQEGINDLFTWCEVNNMKFNERKFSHLRYPSNQETDTTEVVYITPTNLRIPPNKEAKDLGVIMQTNLTFTAQVNKATRMGRQLIGWILRVFHTRDSFALLLLYKSLVLPHLEYCSILTSPYKVKDISLLEGVQRSLTSKISELAGLDYWERLKKLGLFSLERRRERYLIIYTWKIMERIVPNLPVNPISTYTHKRKGRMCLIPPIVRGSSARMKTLKDNFLTV